MKLAIIGTGISGLGAAYLLDGVHDITVYERDSRAGGHSRTLDVMLDGQTFPVDTGFIVFNYRNYPHLTGMFKQLDVPVAKSDMSFGASIGNGFLEYGSKGVFADKRNLLRPRYWRMLADILYFNRVAKPEMVHPAQTLRDYLDELGMGDWFRRYYLQAMGAAIWSCSLETILEFPAATFLRFFANHGLLTINDHPQWYTVQGGSRAYVAKIANILGDRLRLNCGGARVMRNGKGGWTVTDTQGVQADYDGVIFACHADEALAMIDSPPADTAEVLGSFRYQSNSAVLHTDTSFMARNKGCWTSWMYLSENHDDKGESVSLSYWMNNLQPLPTKTPVLVTLNPGREPDAGKVINSHQFTHPVFDQAAIRAQARIPDIQGVEGLWFCGAYQRYGFHEDGLLSAVQVVEKLGGACKWA